MTTILRSLVTAIALAAAGTAHAQFYGILGIGAADLEVSNNPLAPSSNFTTIQFGAGYAFNRHLALEATYLGFGHEETQSGAVFGRWGAKAFGVAGAGRLPLGKELTLLGRLGAYQVTVEHQQALAGPVKILDTTDSFAAASLGGGLEYLIVDGFRLRLMYEQIAGDGDVDGIRIVSLSAVFGF